MSLPLPMSPTLYAISIITELSENTNKMECPNLQSPLWLMKALEYPTKFCAGCPGQGLAVKTR